MRMVIQALSVISLLVSTGCIFSSVSSNNGGATGQTLQPVSAGMLTSGLPRESNPAVAPTDLAELVSGNSDFAFDMYGLLKDEPGNVVFSPYSVSIALAMTYAGARCATKSAMAGALHFALNDTNLHPAFNRLDRDLESRGEGAAGREGEGFTLSIANALWGQSGYPFHRDYIDLLGVNYGAGLSLLDFLRVPDSCRIVINDWVTQETNNKIQDLIPPGAIDPLTVLVLTNAIYFDAMWQDTFPSQATRGADFFRTPDDTVRVPFMNRTSHSVAYVQGTGWQAIELPYDGGDMAMVVLLPDQGSFEAVESRLSREFFKTLTASLDPSHVAIALPKFEFTTSSISLKEPLASLGMGIAFTGAADFTGIANDELFISDVIHKAFIAVDEKGTTAAAATAVMVSRASIEPQPLRFTANRPFLFFIRDVATNTILFAGRVVDPGES